MEVQVGGLPSKQTEMFLCPCPQDRRYAGLKPGELPTCESLKDTIARALPFWNEEIAPKIKAGQRVLIAAHGNSLRGIVKHLEGEAHSWEICETETTEVDFSYFTDVRLSKVV